MPIIVQVGACDGYFNDPIHLLVKKFFFNSQLILIEPQIFLKPILAKNYSFNPNVNIETVAIGKVGKKKLYKLKNDFYDFFLKRIKNIPSYRLPAGSVSENKKHLIDRLKDNLPKEISINDAIEVFEVTSVNLSSILSKYTINNYDLLQIDAEGFDDEVIYNSSINFIKPKFINFEYSYLDQRKKDQLISYLNDLGYVVHFYSKTDALALFEVNFFLEENKIKIIK